MDAAVMQEVDMVSMRHESVAAPSVMLVLVAFDWQVFGSRAGWRHLVVHAPDGSRVMPSLGSLRVTRDTDVPLA